jgi:hypothetical protein
MTHKGACLCGAVRLARPQRDAGDRETECKDIPQLPAEA